MKRVFLYNLLVAMFLMSCSETTLNTDSLRPIVISRDVQTVDDTLFFSNMYMIKLETDKESAIGNIDKIMQSDSVLYIKDGRQKKILLFDMSGNHIRNIHAVGKGHGEYIDLNDFTVDKFSEELLLLVYPNGLMHYTLDGKFKYKDELDKSYTDVACDGDCYYLCNETYPNMKKAGHSLTIIDRKTKKRKSILKLEEEKAPFCSFGTRLYDNGRIFFTRFFDNNIYELADGTIAPVYSVDFGKYSFPSQKMKDKFDCSDLFSMSKSGKYIYALSKLKAGRRYLMFSSNLFDYNLFDVKTGECIHYDKIVCSCLGQQWPSYQPVYGSEDKVCVVIESSVFESVKEILKKAPEMRRKFSDNMLNLVKAGNKSDNPTLLIYTLK